MRARPLLGRGQPAWPQNTSSSHTWELQHQPPLRTVVARHSPFLNINTPHTATFLFQLIFLPLSSIVGTRNASWWIGPDPILLSVQTDLLSEVSSAPDFEISLFLAASTVGCRSPSNTTHSRRFFPLPLEPLFCLFLQVLLFGCYSSFSSSIIIFFKPQHDGTRKEVYARGAALCPA